MMERVFSLDGMMAKSELSFHNQESCSMLSMTLTTMELQLLPQLTTARESSQEAWKEKSESGESENKLKLWKLLSKSIEAELLILRSTRETLKLLVPVMMALASFGT